MHFYAQRLRFASVSPLLLNLGDVIALGRDSSQIQDKHSGQMHTVQLLEVFPYVSHRKRGSMLVRLPPALVEQCGGGHSVRLYCKGADSVMLTLLDDAIYASDAQLETLRAQVRGSATWSLARLYASL